MKRWKILSMLLLLISTILLLSFTFRRADTKVTKRKVGFVPPKGCVFMTVMGEESSDSSFIYKSPEKVLTSMTRGLSWIVEAKNKNGGWGAGSHSRQDLQNPHAVETDPATTSMVAMALLRT